jgi:hypothetical protein
VELVRVARHLDLASLSCVPSWLSAVQGSKGLASGVVGLLHCWSAGPLAGLGRLAFGASVLCCPCAVRPHCRVGLSLQGRSVRPWSSPFVPLVELLVELPFVGMPWLAGPGRSARFGALGGLYGGRVPCGSPVSQLRSRTTLQ